MMHPNHPAGSAGLGSLVPDSGLGACTAAFSLLSALRVALLSAQARWLPSHQP